MTQYNNSQLNKLKSAIKNGTDVVLRLSLNMVQTMKLIFLINYC